MPDKSLDKNVVLMRLAKLNECAARLKRFKNLSLEDYLEDYDTQAIVERNLQLAVQACIDIANYIAARKKLSFPRVQENVFLVLGRAGIIPQKLAERIKGMVNFRNILIHEYVDIDPEKVYRILKECLADFNEFAASVLKFLEESTENGQI